MAYVQNQFQEFDDEIRLGSFEENAILREKRDRVLNRLKTGIERQRQEGKNIPTYTYFNQGSYAMCTGIKPTNGDYDIDVGIEFELDTAKCTDPVEAKEWVYDALNGHTRSVEVRQPCVTVFYQQDGESVYHVDLAIYGNGIVHKELARGRLNSDESNREWQTSDARGLIKAIQDRFLDDDRKQFRRVVRALKKWKHEKLGSSGNGAPPGIGITVLAHELFCAKHRWDEVSNQKKPDDLAALQVLVAAVLGRFGTRVCANLPVVPYSDVLSKMTEIQMAAFKERLEGLRDALNEAAADPDPHPACKKLRRQLGDCFPVPDKETTAQPKGPAIISSGTSA
jgi:hypothetical protein